MNVISVSLIVLPSIITVVCSQGDSCAVWTLHPNLKGNSGNPKQEVDNEKLCKRTCIANTRCVAISWAPKSQFRCTIHYAYQNPKGTRPVSGSSYWTLRRVGICPDDFGPKKRAWLDTIKKGIQKTADYGKQGVQAVGNEAKKVIGGGGGGGGGSNNNAEQPESTTETVVAQETTTTKKVRKPGDVTTPAADGIVKQLLNGGKLTWIVGGAVLLSILGIVLYLIYSRKQAEQKMEEEKKKQEAENEEKRKRKELRKEMRRQRREEKKRKEKEEEGNGDDDE